jgi:hypothetical protein
MSVPPTSQNKSVYEPKSVKSFVSSFNVLLDQCKASGNIKRPGVLYDRIQKTISDLQTLKNSFVKAHFKDANAKSGFFDQTSLGNYKELDSS